MYKKAAIVAAAAGVSLLALTPFAFASDNEQNGDYNQNGTAVQVPIQACNNSAYEGTVGYLAKDLSNKDEHNGKCNQDNSAKN